MWCRNTRSVPGARPRNRNADASSYTINVSLADNAKRVGSDCPTEEHDVTGTDAVRGAVDAAASLGTTVSAAGAADAAATSAVAAR